MCRRSVYLYCCFVFVILQFFSCVPFAYAADASRMAAQLSQFDSLADELRLDESVSEESNDEILDRNTTQLSTSA